MLKLLRAALSSQRHHFILASSVALMLFLSIANQLEMITLGILAGQGGLVRSKGLVARVMHTFENFFSVSSDMELFIALLITVSLFKAVVLFASRYVSQMAAIRINRDLRLNYFKHIQKLSLDFYSRHDVGALASRVVGDAQQITTSITSAFVNYILMPFTVLTTLAGCLWISWKLSMLVFLCFPFVIMPMVFLLGRVRKYSLTLFRGQERFTTVLIDFLAGIETVKTFVAEGFSLKKYNEKNSEMAKLEAKTAKYSLLIRPFLHLMTTALLASIVILGLYVAKMQLADLIAFCGLLYVFYEPVKKFAEENAIIQRGIVAAERMHEVMSLEPEIRDDPGAKALDCFEKSIAFNAVWFRYKEPWVLQGMSFVVEKGEMVAICGSTGAGKSTIARLIARLYEPQKGSITIDGEPIDAFTQESLRSQIGFVPQRPFFFIDTVAQNIAMGSDYSREEIIHAAKLAQAHDFIMALPMGYDTPLEEGGKNLSGGQMQRLAIARALVKKAPILILDEATSSLDTISEQKIKLALEGLRGKITQIVIAHRLSTIESADRILFLEEGRLQSAGPLGEVIESSPSFAAMWQASQLSVK